MKDKFFRWFDSFYLMIYRWVVRVTYSVYVIRKTKNTVKIGKDKKKAIKQRWKEHGIKNINTNEYRIYQELNPDFSEDIVPDTIWHTYIEPYFNDVIYEKGNNDKNYFEFLIGKEHVPYAYLHCINGQLLDHDYLPTHPELIASSLSECAELICKPSIDSGGGRGVSFVKQPIREDTITELIVTYKGNFILQEVLPQSAFMSKFNDTSINTIRIMALIYKGKFEILSSFIRVGESGARLDNVSSGGYFIHINKDGSIKEIAFTKDYKTKKVTACREIESGFDYYGKTIPNWEKVVALVSSVHFKLAHFGIINWDVALDKNDNPIIIEYNLIDSSPSTHQIGNGPILGELTDEICDEIFKR